MPYCYLQKVRGRKLSFQVFSQTSSLTSNKTILAFCKPNPFAHILPTPPAPVINTTLSVKLNNLDEVVSKYGRIDILIHTAGVTKNKVCTEHTQEDVLRKAAALLCIAPSAIPAAGFPRRRSRQYPAFPLQKTIPAA